MYYFDWEILSMNGKYNLVTCNVYKGLIMLSLPIMATSFIQMSYNLMDLIWIGRLEEHAIEATAAVGTIGLVIWFANALAIIPRIGTEVGIANSIGGQDIHRRDGFLYNALYIDIVMAILFSTIILIFGKNIIAFFNFENDIIIDMSEKYMKVMGIGMIFTFLNPVLSGIYNGSGNSKLPFYVNSIGLFINIVLDYFFIFGIWFFPKLGVIGAAVASVISQAVVTFIFLLIIYLKTDILKRFFKFKNNIHSGYIKQIFKIGVPATVHTCVFVLISGFITRIIADWGANAISVQKIGIQIESITWMTTEGFATALSAFVAQNNGANKIERIKESYYKGLKIVGSIGFITMLLLYFIPKQLFQIFIPNDVETLKLGISYLRILSISQVLLSVEIATTGAFNGLGRSDIAAIINIFLTLLRIPGAILILHYNLSLNYMWWLISFTSMLKGLVLYIFFKIYLKNYQRKKAYLIGADTVGKEKSF